MLAWGIRTEVYHCDFYNDTLYPYPSALAKPFGSYAGHYGIFLEQGSSATPTSGTTYMVFNAEYYISVSGGTSVNCTVTCGQSKVIDNAATLAAMRVPRSWNCTFTWSGAPTVTVWAIDN